MAKPIRSSKIKKSAKDKPCSLNIVGVCNYDPGTTVYCHLPDESHGMSLKASDLSGCDGCSSCHDVLDGRVRNDEFQEHKDFYMRRALIRTLNRLVDEDIIRII